jgi:hypothetical protein
MVDFVAFFMLKMIYSIISEYCENIAGGGSGAEDLGLDDQGPGDV